MALPNDRFEVTDDHLKLLRAAHIGWDDCEFGAPAIDAKRPYGNSDVLGDMHEILTGKALGSDWDDPSLTEEQAARYRRLHRELVTVLQIAVQHTALLPGAYESRPYRNEWRPSEPPEVVAIARCPEHGLHGSRTTCFECGGPVEQVPMVDARSVGYEHPAGFPYVISGEGE